MTTSARPPILDIRHVTVYNGTTRALNDLSLSIAWGAHTAILGPNGAGKSTLLRLITRELYPVRRPGSYVRLFGRDTWNVWELRSRLGVVSHELHTRYSGHVRGVDVVLSGYYASTGTWPHQTFRPEQQARARNIMALLGILHLADRPLGKMSAGEQRRFLLARALVHDPDVLILDEPTNGLDLKAHADVMQSIRRLSREGKTIILVTHRLEEIPPEIGRVVLLKEGHVLAEGSKDEILTDTWLSTLFETPLHIMHYNGYYRVVPRSDHLP